MAIARQWIRQPGKGRLLDEDERIQRVAVVAQSSLDEPVVGRILGSGEEGAVEPDSSGLVVNLVLVAVPLGNLDRDVEVQHRALPSSWTGLGRAGSPG